MAPSLSYLLTQFPRAGDSVCLFRHDITAETFWIGYHVGSSRYVCMGLQTQTTGGKTLHQIVRLQMRRALVNRTENDAAVTTSGVWTNSVSALVYGGDSDWADLFGEYKETTTPTGVTAVGVRGMHTTNAGMVKCSIDGDTTLCTLLPTAQQLVDGGSLASTALVANGGNLNPTDRILDQYAAAGGEVVTMLSESLAAGAHVIRFAPTGYKRAASADVRAYLAAFSWLQPGAQDLTATGIDLAFEADIGRAGGSVYGLAISCKPTGSGSNIFIGDGHGNDQQVDIDILLNGSPFTFSANKEYTGGTSVSITRVSQFYHPDVGAGASVVADVTSVFTAHKDNGLSSNHTIDWQQSMDINTAYIAMFPMSIALMDKGNNSALVATTADASLTATDSSKVANAEGQMVYAWDSDGVYGAALYIPDLAVVNNFDDVASDPFYIERGNADKKTYLKRMQTGIVTASTVWGPGEIRYLANRFTAADVALNQNSGAAASKLLLALMQQSQGSTL